MKSIRNMGDDSDFINEYTKPDTEQRKGYIQSVPVVIEATCSNFVPNR